MDILQTVKFHLRVIGCLPIELPSSVPHWCRKIPINQIHTGSGCFLLTYNLISILWFWQYETKTQSDRSGVGFFLFRAVLSLVLYVQLIRERQRLAELIAAMEQMIAKRKGRR